MQVRENESSKEEEGFSSSLDFCVCTHWAGDLMQLGAVLSHGKFRFLQRRNLLVFFISNFIGLGLEILQLQQKITGSARALSRFICQ